MFKIIEDLFGSCDNALHHASSIILVVSHVPLFTDLGHKMELEDVKVEFDSRALSQSKAELFVNLLDRACIFHPANLGGESWITAGPLSERIKAASPISDPANVFKIVLSTSDEAKLRTWMEALSKRFQVALSANDNGRAAKALSDMMRLNILDHYVVAKLFEKAKTDVSHALQSRIDEAHTRHGNFEDAAASVAASRDILEAFNLSQAAMDMLDLVRFSSRIDAIEVSINDRRAEKARCDDAIVKANIAEAGKAAAEAKAMKAAKKHHEETSQAEAKQAVAEAKQAAAEAGKAAAEAKMKSRDVKATEDAKKQDEKIRRADQKTARAEAKYAHAEAEKKAVGELILESVIAVGATAAGAAAFVCALPEIAGVGAVAALGAGIITVVDVVEKIIKGDYRRAEIASLDYAFAKANKAEASEAATEAKAKEDAKKHHEESCQAEAKAKTNAKKDHEETSQAEAKQALPEVRKAAAEAKAKEDAKKHHEETSQAWLNGP
jgi:hypothetical protein